MGPVHGGTEVKPVDIQLIMGKLNKRDLLRSGLDSIRGNLNFQRIYTEYDDQLKSADEVCDIDKLLHVWMWTAARKFAVKMKNDYLICTSNAHIIYKKQKRIEHEILLDCL